MANDQTETLDLVDDEKTIACWDFWLSCSGEFFTDKAAAGNGAKVYFIPKGDEHPKELCDFLNHGSLPLKLNTLGPK